MRWGSTSSFFFLFSPMRLLSYLCTTRWRYCVVKNNFQDWLCLFDIFSMRHCNPYWASLMVSFITEILGQELGLCYLPPQQVRFGPLCCYFIKEMSNGYSRGRRLIQCSHVGKRSRSRGPMTQSPSIFRALIWAIVLNRRWVEQGARDIYNEAVLIQLWSSPLFSFCKVVRRSPDHVRGEGGS